MGKALPKPPVPLWRRVPADPADHFTADEVARAKEYQRPIKRVKRIFAPVAWGASLAWVGFDVGPWTADAVGGPWPLRLVAVLALYVAAVGVVNLPASLWRKLRHDKRWGFSKQTLGGVAKDTLKAFALILVIASALLIPLWAVIRATGLWWIYGAALVGAFFLLIRTIAPFLLRAFNKLEPLTDGPLKERLRAIAAEAGAPVRDYLVMDASKRTSKDNAMFAGTGKTKSVIVFDNLLEMPEEQVAVVVAHELGHWRRARPIRDLVIEVATWPLALGLVALITSQASVLEFAGVAELGEPGALPLFVATLFAIGELTQYGNLWWSRRGERLADFDALELTRDPGAFAGTWKSMRERNLPDLDPSWFERLKMSHPPIAERLAFGEIWARARTEASAGTPAP